MSPAPSSARTPSVVARCLSACGLVTSMTWIRKSATTTSSSVALKASTSPWGSRRMKPTVSVTSSLRLPGQHHLAGRRVERREQLVLGQDMRPGQRVQQRGLAGVRVADDRGRRAPAPASGAGAGRRAAAGPPPAPASGGRSAPGRRADPARAGFRPRRRGSRGPAAGRGGSTPGSAAEGNTPSVRARPGGPPPGSAPGPRTPPGSPPGGR